MHPKNNWLSNLQPWFPFHGCSGGAQAETTAQKEPDIDQVCGSSTQLLALIPTRLQHQKAELTKSPHEFGLEVSLLPGYPNVYQNPGGPVEVPSTVFLTA